MADRELWQLRQMQSLPLEIKISLSKDRIRQWVHEFGEEGVYIAFSGGKDSTVLLDIVRNVCGFSSIPAVYCDTGLEFPEIREFVKTFDNVVFLKPKMNFKQAILKYGYPFISKPISNTVFQAKNSLRNGKDGTTRLKKIRGEMLDNNGNKSQFNCEKYAFLLNAPFDISDKCCEIFKHNPSYQYENETGRKPMLGQLAEESIKRRNAWLKTGCNGFQSKRPQSNPLAFWTEQDILAYIKTRNLPICNIYGDIVYKDKDGMQYDEPIFNESMKLETTGCKRTGCMFCGYGCHLNNDTRFIDMKKTHPKQYEWIMKPIEEGGLGYKQVIDWLNEHGNLGIRY